MRVVSEEMEQKASNTQELASVAKKSKVLRRP